MRTMFIVNDEPLTVPAGIHEMTWSQFISLMGVSDPMEVVEVLTGKDLRGANASIVNVLLTMCDWITDLDMSEEDIRPVNRFEIDGRDVELPDPELCTFGQKITAASLEGVSSSPLMLCTYLWQQFRDDEFNSEEISDLMQYVEGLTVLEVMGGAKWIAESIEAVQRKWKELSSVSVSAKESRAGIDRLMKYGDFTTLERMAGGDILKLEAVERRQWGTVLLMASYKDELADYQERLLKENND